MAFTGLHGKRGSVTMTGVTFETLSWTVSATCDVAEASIMDITAAGATVHWKEYLPGFKDWTATIECILPTAGVGLTILGTEVEITFDTVETGGRLYKGNAILTGVSPSSSSSGIGAVSLVVQGTDQLEENST